MSDLLGTALIQHFQKRPEDLKRMDRRKFEQLIAELFDGFGYSVELTQQTRDGGKDIVAVKSIHDISVKYLIECKRPDPGGYVSVGPVRELLGVKKDEGATKGILVTTERFSPDAKKLFDRHQWELESKEYADVVHWIDDYIAMKAGSPQP